MKISNTTRLTAESLPDWPKGESLDTLLKHINQSNESLTQSLQQNITINDNLNAAIVKEWFIHGTEKKVRVPDGIKGRPIGVQVVRCDGISGGVRYTVQSIDWRFIDSTDPKDKQQLGVTIRFQPPFGSAIALRTTNQSINNATITPVQFDSTSGVEGTNASWSSGSNTKISFSAAGQVEVDWQAQFDTVAGGVREGWVRLNGAGVYYGKSLMAGGNYAGLGGSDEITVASGDYIELQVQQTSAGALNLFSGSPERIHLRARYVAPPSTAKNDVTFVIYGG